MERSHPGMANDDFVLAPARGKERAHALEWGVILASADRWWGNAM
jgi:hypothetical protein